MQWQKGLFILNDYKRTEQAGRSFVFIKKSSGPRIKPYGVSYRISCTCVLLALLNC